MLIISANMERGKFKIQGSQKNFLVHQNIALLGDENEKVDINISQKDGEASLKGHANGANRKHR